jgi:regulator of nucleoside diphosphate kinase
MKKNKTNLIVRRDDLELLSDIIRMSHAQFDRQNLEDLRSELKKAQVVDKDSFPPDVIRLNSRVMIREGDRKDIIELILVTPDLADIKSRKISVLAPVGTALFGFRKGQQVEWQVPAGKKKFLITEVVNM